MKTLLSFIFLFSASVHSACDFKSNGKNIYSFSGPMTIALRDLNLLKINKVKGISVFHPISSSEYKGKVFSGGVFLAKSVLEDFSHSIVFYDDSRELSKILKAFPSIKAISVKTRGLTPLEVTALVISKLESITQNCEKEIIALKQKHTSLSEEVLRKLSHKPSHVYFLGEFKNGRFPELIIANDGVVKWLREENRILTYPSDLPYVNWSSRILQSMPKGTMYIGLKDSGRDLVKEVKRSGDKITLIYPGVLVPGITQLEGLKYLLEKL